MPFPVTRDQLLGGRVPYTQPRDGFRAAVDPVLLAAAVPAKPGELVLDGGTGAGAALLCLAARVPGIRGIGIDRDFDLLRLARANAGEWPGLSFAAADVMRSPVKGGIDHAFANPPYHRPDGTKSPELKRESAKRGSAGLIAAWIAALSAPLRHRGTLTLILPPWLLEPCLTAMRAADTAAEIVFPLRPRAGEAARLMLVRGRRHGKAPLVLASGLVLHDASGAFRGDVEAILRDAAPLPLE